MQIEELAAQKAALQQWAIALQEDFDYNLDLLDGRDAELAQHEEYARIQTEEIAKLSAQNQELVQKLLVTQQSDFSSTGSLTELDSAV